MYSKISDYCKILTVMARRGLDDLKIFPKHFIWLLHVIENVFSERYNVRDGVCVFL